MVDRALRVPFRFPGKTRTGVFLSRPNRFLAVVSLDGQQVEAHVADSGRLAELLCPGREVCLAGSAATGRRTAYTVIMARAPKRPLRWVCVDSLMANRVACRALELGSIRGLEGPWSIRPEIKTGRSRLDFQLERPGQRVLVEVKSVTLASGGMGLFPDAPTQRGARHLAELASAASNTTGVEAALLFCAGRDDVEAVAPNTSTDPEFTRACIAARKAGVGFFAARWRYTRQGAIFAGQIPVVF